VGAAPTVGPGDPRPTAGADYRQQAASVDLIITDGHAQARAALYQLRQKEHIALPLHQRLPATKSLGDLPEDLCCCKAGHGGSDALVKCWISVS
jgi:hypothetical protein